METCSLDQAGDFDHFDLVYAHHLSFLFEFQFYVCLRINFESRI